MDISDIKDQRTSEFEKKLSEYIVGAKKYKSLTEKLKNYIFYQYKNSFYFCYDTDTKSFGFEQDCYFKQYLWSIQDDIINIKTITSVLNEDVSKIFQFINDDSYLEKTLIPL